MAVEEYIAAFSVPARVFGPHELRELSLPADRFIHAFVADLRSMAAWVMGAGEAALYERPEIIFEHSASAAFPSAEVDMDEAVRCFALERYTASVFHCMRVMEVGLAALSRALNLDLSENWNRALDLIEKDIRSRNSSAHDPSWREDERFYSGAAVHFRLIKNAWRNHVIHKQDHYDERRSRQVLADA